MSFRTLCRWAPRMAAAGLGLALLLGGDCGGTDPYGTGGYTDGADAGGGPIDPDVFQQSVDNFDDYLRSRQIRHP